MGKTDQLNRIAYIQNWCHDAGFVAWLKDNPDEAPWHYRIFVIEQQSKLPHPKH